MAARRAPLITTGGRTIQLGILIAVCCAVVTNLAFFFKQRGAVGAAPVRARHPLRSGRALFGSRWFAIGMAVAAVAWILHVAALTLAPSAMSRWFWPAASCWSG